jgi:hypothetical protein
MQHDGLADQPLTLLPRPGRRDAARQVRHLGAVAGALPLIDSELAQQHSWYLVRQSAPCSCREVGSSDDSDDNGKVSDDDTAFGSNVHTSRVSLLRDASMASQPGVKLCRP